LGKRNVQSAKKKKETALARWLVNDQRKKRTWPFDCFKDPGGKHKVSWEEEKDHKETVYKWTFRSFRAANRAIAAFSLRRRNKGCRKGKGSEATPFESVAPYGCLSDETKSTSLLPATGQVQQEGKKELRESARGKGHQK